MKRIGLLMIILFLGRFLPLGGIVNATEILAFETEEINEADVELILDRIHN